MSKNIFQEYLHCYQQLNNPQLSKQANQRLLEIEDSTEAWSIAYQLLSIHNNSEITLHGAQLLSKKLNVPPPVEIDLASFLNYLYLLPQKASLIWLCIAKIMIHMSPSQPFLPQELALTEKFKLLKEVPAAITHIRTKQQMDATFLKQAYLSLALPLIIKEGNQNKGLIIQCLDSFVSYGTKVRNSQVMKVLMSFPFEDGGHIIQQILGRQNYPDLQNDILFYLQKNRKEQKVYELYLAYFKCADLTNISFQQLRSAFQFILNSLVIEQTQSKTKLSQSYQLWNHIASQYRQKQLPDYIKQIIKDALLTVWKITCKQAVLTELPDKPQTTKDPLDLDIADNSEQVDNHYEMNKQMEYFREYAGDFFMLCYETLSAQPQALKIMNDMINDLVVGQLTHLQLAIRIIFSLSPAKNNVVMHTAPIIVRIFNRSNQMNEYICREVIRMIGQLGEVLESVPDLLAPALQFLSNSFLFPSLAIMASSSCNNLLEEMDLSKATGLADIMQTFMEHVYEVIFRVDCEEKVIEFLSKSMAIFIYKVRQSPAAYASYLTAFSDRITKQPKESQQKFIESAIAAQIWINSREQIAKSQSQQNYSMFNDYMPPFATFLQNLMPVILQLLNVSEKKLFFKRIVMISTALRTDCIGNGQIWVQLCNYLLQTFLRQVSPSQVGKIIAPIINLTRAAYELKIPQVAVNVAKCLKKWHKQITSFLDLTLNRIDLIISSTIIYFHVRIAQLIKQFPQCAEMIQYSPDQLVQYLIWVLTNKQVWEYQLFKYTLQYFLLVLQLGFPPESIVRCILGNFDRLQQALWTCLDPILSFIFKNYGFGIYDKVLGQMNSSLGDKSNPLNTVLRQAFQKGEGKTVKNLLLSL